MAYGVRSSVPDALFLSQFGAEMRLEALVVFVGSFFVLVFGSEEKGGRERERERGRRKNTLEKMFRVVLQCLTRSMCFWSRILLSWFGSCNGLHLGGAFALLLQ
jgi:hypothetical protein